MLEDRLTRMQRITRASLAGLCLATVSLAITGALYEKDKAAIYDKILSGK